MFDQKKKKMYNYKMRLSGSGSHAIYLNFFFIIFKVGEFNHPCHSDVFQHHCDFIQRIL